jgi:hypothetical protein
VVVQQNSATHGKIFFAKQLAVHFLAFRAIMPVQKQRNNYSEHGAWKAEFWNVGARHEKE